MKSIKQHIKEALKINSKSKVITKQYNYFPETKQELIHIMYKRFESEGYECDLNNINVSKITDMSRLFYRFNKFNGDISNWNVSNVTNMIGMFEESKFNGDISNWNVSNVTNMSYMFRESNFNGNISKWDVSNVEYMDYMFFGSKFDGKNGDLSNWNVSNVEDMHKMFFKSNIDKNFLNQIKSWNIKKCTDFCNIFSNTPFFRDEYTINEISKLWDYRFFND